jgi:SAM-dependent methyltransferase
MKLRKPLPSGRTYSQVEHHYLVEKGLADGLKQSDREQRKRIYATMYDELFRQVPDHPRLTRRATEIDTQRVIRSNVTFIRRFLTPSTVLVEFAPGHCKFLMALAPRVKRVCGVDLSDQRDPNDDPPNNLELVIYDGYTVEGIAAGSADVAFSNQLIEHIHPDDIRLHFEQVRRLLKDGGRYVLCTPHALLGPHDVSQYFSDVPQGFHLKEWTYSELVPEIRAAGFSRVCAYWYVRQLAVQMPFLYFVACETMARRLQGQCVRRVLKYLVPSIWVVAIR